MKFFISIFILLYPQRPSLLLLHQPGEEQGILGELSPCGSQGTEAQCVPAAFVY